MNRLQALHEAGVSIWLDTLSRDYDESDGRDGFVSARSRCSGGAFIGHRS